MNPLELIGRSPLWSQPPLWIVASLAVTAAFLIIAAAIVMDFKRYYRQSREVVGSDRSLVETGTMAGFFVVYYLVIRAGAGQVHIAGAARDAMLAFGLALVLAGAAFNVYGRVVLSSRWANQIKVYEGQTLATNGPFALVRHPLYASLIWMFVGGSLVYANPVSLAMTLGIFVPMMYARSRKEDAVLEEVFGAEFEEYRKRTGMFLPKLWR